MKKYFILSLFALAGCTSDNYIPKDAGMNDALHTCKKEANDKFYADNSPLGGIGAGAAGVLGGGIGGALVGAISAANAPDTAMRASDINPYTERCMNKKGYEGTSTNTTM